MPSADQVLLFIELCVFLVLILRLLIRRQFDETESYLIAYLGLSAVASLLWLARLTFPILPLLSIDFVAAWARFVPVLAFGALTMAFIRQSRLALAWSLGSVGLLVILSGLHFGWLFQAPWLAWLTLVASATLALAGAALAIMLAYRRQTSPLHRNRYYYWTVALVLLTSAQVAMLADGFSGLVFSRVPGWMAAALSTYAISHIHLPNLRSLLRQALHFLILTFSLGLVAFGILAAVQRLDWPALTERESFLLTGVIALATAILLPGLLNVLVRLLNYLIFGSDYDEQEVVRHYSQSVSNIIDMDRLASVAFDVISHVFNLEQGVLLLMQYMGGGLTTVLPVHSFGPVPTQPIEVETFGALMNRFRQGSPLTQYDIDVLPAFRRIPQELRQWLSDTGMELYVPIRSQDEVIGALALGPKSSGEPFSRDDLNLLRTLADQTVAALKNAQMVQDMRRLNLDISRLNVELESMNRTKTDFISIASHELRTPLSQVSGYCHLLAEELSPESPLSALVDGLLKGSDRLTDIVDVMLDVSQMDVGSLALDQTTLDIGSVIRRAAQEWEAALNERGHNILTEDLENLPALEGDGERLQQVFSQLINNAIKYTPDGGDIEIRGQVHSESSGMFVEIVVTDSGIGVNTEDQRKIFDKFYRTGDLMKHSTGKTKFKGAGPGLGLSLVKGIVSAHGGRVWVESPGHDEETCPGSSFHVLLPLTIPHYDPHMAETVIHRQSITDLSNYF